MLHPRHLIQLANALCEGSEAHRVIVNARAAPRRHHRSREFWKIGYIRYALYSLITQMKDRSIMNENYEWNDVAGFRYSLLATTYIKMSVGTAQIQNPRIIPVRPPRWAFCLELKSSTVLYCAPGKITVYWHASRSSSPHRLVSGRRTRARLL